MGESDSRTIFVTLALTATALVLSGCALVSTRDNIGRPVLTCAGLDENYPYDTATAPRQEAFDRDQDGELNEQEFKEWSQACRKWEASMEITADMPVMPETSDAPADDDPITSDLPQAPETTEAPSDTNQLTPDLPVAPETSGEGGMVPAPATPDRAVPVLPPDM